MARVLTLPNIGPCATLATGNRGPWVHGEAIVPMSPTHVCPLDCFPLVTVQRFGMEVRC